MLNDLAALYTDNVAVFAGSVFLLGLVIGSFLNVVIYRLPIMLERDWRAQSAELLLSPHDAASITSVPQPVPERFNLSTPRSACPTCKVPIKAKNRLRCHLNSCFVQLIISVELDQSQKTDRIAKLWFNAC